MDLKRHETIHTSANCIDCGKKCSGMKVIMLRSCRMHDMHFGSKIKKIQIKGYMGYGDRFLSSNCFKFFGILYLKKIYFQIIYFI